MDTVYKYCGAHGLKILRDLELKVTPPNQFNDPFEFTPTMFCSDPVRYATRNLEREPNLKVLYEMCRSDGKFSGSFREFQEIAKKEMPKWIAILAEAPQYTLPLVEEEFLDEVSKRHGVLCMSQRRDSILMWGHYCDKPLGLVIGFDSSSVFFHQGKGLRPVTYVSNRVVHDACWEDGSPEMANFENQIIFSKSVDWIYEQEFRQIFTLSSLTKKPLEEKSKNSRSFLRKCARSFLRCVGLRDKDHTLGYFLSFPPEAVVSVTLGPRSSPELESEVQQILQKPCFSHVEKPDRAVLHKNDFVIEFE